MSNRLPFLSDEFHFAIANVAVRSSQMEHHIERAFADALRELPNTAEFMLKNLGQDRVVKGMRAAMVDISPSEADAIDKLVKEIERVRTERNEILHFVWGKAEKADEAIQASFRPFRESQVKNKTAKQVQQIAIDMQQVTMWLVDWQDALYEKRRRALLEKLVPPAALNSLASLAPRGRKGTSPPLQLPKGSSRK